MFATAFISDDLELARKPARSCYLATGRCASTEICSRNAGFDQEMEGIRAAGKRRQGGDRGGDGQDDRLDVAGRVGRTRA